MLTYTCTTYVTTCCLNRTFYKQLPTISKPTLGIVSTLPKRAKPIRVKVDGHCAALLSTDAEHFFPPVLQKLARGVFSFRILSFVHGPIPLDPVQHYLRSQDLRLLSEMHFSRNIPHAASFYLFQKFMATA